jgi:YggT family protein
MGFGRFVSTFLDLYATLIFVYIVMSWIVGSARGAMRDIYNALGMVCEPYLSIFRRILPPIMIGSGGLDLSPLVGLFVLQLLASFVARLGV